MIPLDICVDVSHWQGAIDWPAVFGDDIRIAMIKATEGVGGTDPLFDLNRIRAEEAGLIVIPYHFLRPGDAIGQADHFREVAQLDFGAPYALDWEGRASQTASATEVETIGAALESVTGRLPLGYWGIYGSTPALPTERMQTWPRWVPRYPRAGISSFIEFSAEVRENLMLYWVAGRSGSTNVMPYFAQYTSEGRVAGIDRLVDRSVAFFPTVEAAIDWCRSSATAPAPATTPVDIVFAAVRVLQSALVTAGYDAGPADGDFGRRSQRAMDAFRARSHD